MNIRKFLVTATLFFLSVYTASSQAQNFTYTNESPVSIGTSLSFHSTVLDDERQILISLPDNYDSSTKRYPVIYLLDAQYFFEFQYAYGLINALTFLEDIPEVILIGVASKNRDRDLIPSRQNAEGNAEGFLEFFRKELQVFIDQKYRTEPYRILIGHSAGGVFALHTLFNAPDTFNAYIAISPAVWADDGKFLEEMKGVLNTSVKFNNNLFTSLSTEGGREQEIYDEYIGMLDDARPTGLEFHNMSFPDEDHSSTIMTGMHQGLLSVYENWAPPDSINSLEALVSHYQKLSAHYGYSLDVPVKHASNVGFNLIRNGDPEAALEVFQYSLLNISQDSIAHYQVAFALRRLGRLTEALSEFDKAIEIGSGTDMYSIFVRFRDEVAQEIREQNSVLE